MWIKKEWEKKYIWHSKEIILGLVSAILYIILAVYQ